MGKLTVHHLHFSQSERIPWLLEELNIPYTLKNYQRAPIFAPDAYKALHPSGTAPVIHDTDGDLTLAESGACVEYIAHRYGEGRLFVPPSDPSYADFLYWWHWSNGTFQPVVARLMGVRRSGGRATTTTTAGSSGSSSSSTTGGRENKWLALVRERLGRSLNALEARLKENTWLAGAEFTAADIMVVFTLTTMRRAAPYSLEEYPNILAYLQRIGKREAYRTAMAKSDPDMELALGPDPPVRAKM